MTLVCVVSYVLLLLVELSDGVLDGAFNVACSLLIFFLGSKFLCAHASVRLLFIFSFVVLVVSILVS